MKLAHRVKEETMKASIVPIAALDSRWRVDIEVEPIRHTPNLVALVLFVLLISLVRFIIAFGILFFRVFL